MANLKKKMTLLLTKCSSNLLRCIIVSILPIKTKILMQMKLVKKQTLNKNPYYKNRRHVKS